MSFGADRLLNFSVPIGRISRILVRLHWSMLLVAAYFLYTFSDNLKLGVLVILALFGSVLLHELGHCWGARRVGGDAREILLWPLGGLAMIHAPMRPWPQFFSTLTGPLTNVLIIALTVPIFVLAGGDAWAFVPGVDGSFSPTLGLLFLYYLVQVNLVMAIFNIVPAFPLDGGRMLQAALWPKFGFHKATTVAVYLSFVTAGLGLVYAIFGAESLMLGLICVWVIQGANQERQRLRYGLYDDLGGAPWSSGMGEFQAAPESEPSAFARWRDRRRQRREDAEARRKTELRMRLDEVLAKVSAVGLDGLSKDERTFLDLASKELRKEQSGKS